MNKKKILSDYKRILSNILKFFNSEKPPRPQLLFDIQKNIIEKILTIEKEHKTITKKIKILEKKILRHSKLQNIKEIRKLQILLMTYKEGKEDLLYYISCYRLLGDTIAFKFIDVHTIRQDSKVLLHPGFISDKTGLKAEIKTAKYLSEHHCYILLHDITNSLRFGDISFFNTKTNFQRSIIEVKLKNKKASKGREARQENRLKTYSKYLNEDYINDKESLKELFPHVYNDSQGAPDSLRAFTSKFDESNNYHILHQAILKNKNKFIYINKIISYLLIKNRSYLRKSLQEKLLIKKFLNNAKIKPFVSAISRRITELSDIPPFTGILDHNTSCKIIFGNWDIVTFVNIDELIKKFKKFKITLYAGIDNDNNRFLFFIKKYKAKKLHLI